MEMYKRIYVTIGIGPDGNPFFKTGDTNKFDVGERDTYVREWSIIDWEAITDTGERYRDYDIHEFIDREFKDVVYRTVFFKKGREQFDICKDSELYKKFLITHSWNDEAIEICKELLNEIRIQFHSGVKHKKHDFPLRTEQQDYTNKTLHAFQELNYKKMLCAAKMRFGKTFANYNVAMKLNAKNVLILTYKPQAKSSWRTDLETHIAFDGCKFFDYKNDSYPTLDADKMNVFFVSYQAILSDSREESDKYEWIKTQPWDVVIIDEIHYGIDTDKAKKILSSLQHTYELHLSGTPFKQMLIGDFNEDNTFVWTYQDEQLAKEKELLTLSSDFDPRKTMYQTLPKMKMISISLDWNDEQLSRFYKNYSEDEMQTFTKMLGTDEKGEFIYPSTVNTLLDTLFINVFEESTAIVEQSAKDHIFVLVSSVASGHALVKALQQHSLTKKGYKVIDACGCGENVEYDIENVKLETDTNDKTITVSCGRFTEAVTVPKWGIVVIMNDMKSPSLYMQTIFRCQSPNARKNSTYKQECYVVDFNINRMLSSIYAYVSANADKSVLLEENFRTFLRCAPIYNFYVAKTLTDQLDFQSVFELAKKQMYEKPVFTGSSVRSPEKYDDIHVATLLKIDCNKKLVAKFDKILSENKKIKNGKSFSTKNMKKVEDEIDDKLENTTLAKLLEACRCIEMKMPLYLELSDVVEYCLNDVLMNTNNVFEEEKFEMCMNITREEFKQLIDVGFFDVCALNDRICYYATIEELS